MTVAAIFINGRPVVGFCRCMHVLAFPKHRAAVQWFGDLARCTCMCLLLRMLGRWTRHWEIVRDAHACPKSSHKSSRPLLARGPSQVKPSRPLLARGPSQVKSSRPLLARGPSQVKPSRPLLARGLKVAFSVINVSKLGHFRPFPSVSFFFDVDFPLFDPKASTVAVAYWTRHWEILRMPGC
jgi:hypothetical protein